MQFSKLRIQPILWNCFFATGIFLISLNAISQTQVSITANPTQTQALLPKWRAQRIRSIAVPQHPGPWAAKYLFCDLDGNKKSDFVVVKGDGSFQSDYLQVWMQQGLGSFKKHGAFVPAFYPPRQPTQGAHCLRQDDGVGHSLALTYWLDNALWSARLDYSHNPGINQHERLLSFPIKRPAIHGADPI